MFVSLSMIDKWFESNVQRKARPERMNELKSKEKPKSNVQKKNPVWFKSLKKTNEIQTSWKIKNPESIKLIQKIQIQEHPNPKNQTN